jgi:ferritin
MPSLRETYAQVYNRQSVLFEESERASVSVKLSTDKSPRRFSLADVYAKDILKTASMYDNDLNVGSLVSEWVKRAGWSSSEAETVLVPLIINIIKKNIDPSEMRELQGAINILISQKKRVNNFSNSIQQKSDNFLDFFSNGLSNKYISNVFNKQSLIDEIINISFTEGNVGVGRGEVFITLFSEATNPSKGDIQLKDGSTVEVKGPDGRAGGNAISNTKNAFSEILNHLEKYYNEVEKNVEKNIKVKIKDLIKKIEESDSLKTPGKNKKPSRDFNSIKKNIIDVYTNKNIKNIEPNFIQREVNAIQKILDRHNIDFSYEDLRKDFVYYKKSILSDFAGQGDVFNKFTEYVYKTDLNNTPKIISLVKKFTDQQDKRTESFINNFIFESKKQSYGEFNESIKTLIAALQVIDYAKIEKFKYILFFNIRNKNQVVFEITDNVTNMLQDFTSKSNLLKIGAGTGGGLTAGGDRGGFQINVR